MWPQVLGSSEDSQASGFFSSLDRWGNSRTDKSRVAKAGSQTVSATQEPAALHLSLFLTVY